MVYMCACASKVMAIIGGEGVYRSHLIGGDKRMTPLESFLMYMYTLYLRLYYAYQNI